MGRIAPDWIAADWGTSALRVWAMGPDGAVLAEARADTGMGALAPDGFEGALRALIAPWTGGRDGEHPLRVLVCGMAGARGGWAEAGYAAVPCPPAGGAAVRAPSAPDLDVRLLPGLSQAEPPDVIRGEETQVAGFLEGRPGWDGVLCLPGTHAKWVRVSAAEVVGFRTAMTGEMFAALSRHTVLRHALAEEGWDDAAFLEAVAEGMARPEALGLRLFAIRAEGLLRGLPGGVARARLSGLLIGAELQALRPWWLGERVALVASGSLGERYAAALGAQGVRPERADADAAVLAGLRAAKGRVWS
ncbi:2-keto-3-deoxy-galactonokinase [Rubellimicrobium sp. CFH 75288]|nr:2-dehydro-3-deoxygalactonokinase [Rubellimicrobium sp. CFH 75288]NAZ37523.1 2-keto-3-deoxy-galactonokinase [Rubellimicrobium sp. CFH 75288]